MKREAIIHTEDIFFPFTFASSTNGNVKTKVKAFKHFNGDSRPLFKSFDSPERVRCVRPVKGELT